MLLRKVEIYGFKSFADRSEIVFGPGVTAIVGPNGSGKSNVSDAIRWALGEQSIRTLRGTKTEDVIFAGSSKRRSHGAAEVSLIFDNSDGLLPLEYNEVTITRRAFRTGESEYFINKTPCRLKDIHDLLADTGLGRDSMTVIGQNKIDELLNARPEERRLAFEEAAGITKYKHRKREALRKLDETQQNLARVHDLTSEIENQLGPMAESAERTAKYNKLHDELTACQVTMLLAKLDHAQKMLASVELEQAALADAELASSTRLNITEAERERLTQELENHEKILNEVLQSITLTGVETERSEGKIALLKERSLQGQRDTDRIEKEIQLLDEERIVLLQKISDLKILHHERTEADKACSDALEAFLGQDRDLVSAIRKLETEIHTGNEETFDHMQELVTERNNHRTTERDITLQKSRLANLERELKKQEEELSSTRKIAAELENDRCVLEHKIEKITEQLSQVTQSRELIQVQINDLAALEREYAKKTDTLSSRLNVLSAMQEEFEGFGRGAKSILKNNMPWNKEICGAVAQLITVSDSYVTAIETALGGALQYIVTENDDIAKQAIQYLKDQKLGRTTFLPLTNIRAQKPRDNEITAAHAEGAIGFASQLVRYDAKYQIIVEYLLGRTVVAENIDYALKIAKQSGQSVKIVTLDGDVINPGGSITGGSLSKREASILSRRNEIETLYTELETIDQNRKEISRRLAAMQDDLKNHDLLITDLLNDRRSLEINIAELSIRIEKNEADYRRLQQAHKTILTEIEMSIEDDINLQHKLTKIMQKIIQLENQDIEKKNHLDALQLQLKQMKDDKEQLVLQITEYRVRQSALRQDLSALASELSKLASEDLIKLKQREKLILEIEILQKNLIDLSEQLSVEIAARENLLAKKTALEHERDSLYNQKLVILAETQKLDKETKELRRKLQAAQARLHEMQLLSAKYKYEQTFNLEQLHDRYGLTTEQAVAMRRPESQAELEALVYRLETALHQIGPVNPAAIEEYARLKERYDFLQVQYNDLTSAKQYLSSVIADIDNTMSRQFRSAFKTINEYFQDTFIRLFGGGQASLSMLDPDDVLESGIEIFVQPPGKKQQNLALLSGGERALTVIALLFAFLTYKPAPFTVVDEIDAALDEANVQRFSEFLRDYAQNTQFIVVTHRKGTMEIADVMIGITMEESGVSRLVSVKFMEKAG